jgi:hypothetical protein
MEQIRANLSKDQFPLYVSEGRHEDKENTIGQNDYLQMALEKLKTSGKGQKTAFFTFGVSFNPSDQHILKAMAESECRSYFIGVYGKDSDDRKHQLYAHVKKVLTRDHNIHFYDTAEVHPWHEGTWTTGRVSPTLEQTLDL